MALGMAACSHSRFHLLCCPYWTAAYWSGFDHNHSVSGLIKSVAHDLISNSRWPRGLTEMQQMNRMQLKLRGIQEQDRV